jgi:AraC-like DNA-binding protein
MTERLFLRLQEDLTQGPESAVPAATLHSLPVPIELRQQVAHSLMYRETLADGAVVSERVLPDGAVRLVLDLTTPTSATGEAPNALIIGASSSAAMVRLQGQMHGLSITLLPGATMDLFGVPAGELTGTAVSLRELLQDHATALSERLATAPGAEARVEVMWSLLRQRLQRRPTTASAQVARAVRVINATGDRVRMRDVADAIGVGERRLQQLFHTHVGLSPRTMVRISRLHHLLRALRRRPTDGWAALAVDGGFCDQSHLVNEFQSLCGLTPTEFIGRTVSGSSKTAS